MGRAEDLFTRLKDAGLTEIDGLIADRQSEELFLDFKQSADKGEGSRLHDDDRKNLGKALSGFGNSEGGIIIWGVDCRPNATVGDVAARKVPIENPRRFKSWLEGAVSGCTVPPHPMVQHHAIESDSGRGFVVSYIAKSALAPHQCLKPSLQYYIRAGSDFVPTPHAVLLGMFGRRPQPFVFPMWVLGPAEIHKMADLNISGVRCSLGIQLGSHGPGTARDLYMNVHVIEPQGNTQQWMTPNDKDWRSNLMYGKMMQIISLEAFRLTPQAAAQPVTLTMVFAPPFDTDFRYKIIFGYEGSPTQIVEKIVSKEIIQTSYDRFMSDPAGDAYAFVKEVFQIDPRDKDPGPEY